MASILNQKHTRQFALDVAAKHRNGRFTRVSQDFLDRIEARTKKLILDEIHRHPSLGKTLK